MFSRSKLGSMVLLIVGLLALSTMLAAAQQGGPDKKPPPPEMPSVADISDEGEVMSEEARANDGDADWPAGGEVSPAAVAAYDAVTWRVQNRLGVGTDAPTYQVDVRQGADLHNADSGSQLIHWNFW